jgi:hypothetical protein
VADSEVKVEVNPTTSLIAPPINTEPLAAALLKSSENQAAATMTLAAALSPQKEANSLTTTNGKPDPINLLLIGLIVWLAFK